MSVVNIIAYDYPLPLIEMEIMCIGHRDFPHGRYDDFTDEADNYIKKEYKYSISLEPSEKCLVLFQNYLNEHMKNNSEVELWSIWLGIGFKDYYEYRPQLKNISKKVYHEVFDEMDDYIESLPAVIKKKRISIKELTQEDILLFNKSFYTCTSIMK